MADAPKGKTEESNKTILLAAIACILLSISWTVYEFVRPLTEEEIKQQKENAKIAKEIEDAKKPRTR